MNWLIAAHDGHARKGGDRLSLFACFVGGLAAGAALGRRIGAIARPRRMPHLRIFRAGLARTRGEAPAALLAARIQARYETLCAARPRFAHPALRWRLMYQILPGLALYQTLQENATQRGAAPATTLAEAGALLDGLDVLARRLPLLQYAPFAFSLFRPFTRLLLLLYPSTGYDIQMVEDSRRSIAFTVRRCFYLDVLSAYGARELTACYCHLDDVAFAALPPCIAWERTTTLGCGGTCCDFRWSAAPAEPASGRSLLAVRPSGAARGRRMSARAPVNRVEVG
jgi:L-2-amino-thiazoline-4-carboxylic acid hydrolase